MNVFECVSLALTLTPHPFRTQLKRVLGREERYTGSGSNTCSILMIENHNWLELWSDMTLFYSVYILAARWTFCLLSESILYIFSCPTKTLLLLISLLRVNSSDFRYNSNTMWWVPSGHRWAMVYQVWDEFLLEMWSNGSFTTHHKRSRARPHTWTTTPAEFMPKTWRREAQILVWWV
jgi:hypothetical protein